MSGKFRIVEHLMAPAATKLCSPSLNIDTSVTCNVASGGNCVVKPEPINGVTDIRVGGRGEKNNTDCKCEDGQYPAVFTDTSGKSIKYKVLCPESKPVQNDCTRWSGEEKNKCCTANPFVTDTNANGTTARKDKLTGDNIRSKGCELNTPSK